MSNHSALIVTFTATKPSITVLVVRARYLYPKLKLEHREAQLWAFCGNVAMVAFSMKQLMLFFNFVIVSMFLLNEFCVFIINGQVKTEMVPLVIFSMKHIYN